MPAALPGMINGDLAEPILAFRFGADSDHRKKPSEDRKY
jgi:hypothetical protein